MTTLTFTPTESKVLRHRIECPDALWDVLTDEGQHPEWTEADVSAKCRDLLRPATVTLDTDDPLAVWLVTDAIEGSTFYEDLDDAVALREITKGAALTYLKARKTIEIKMTEIGIEVTFP